jgi:hypothetical protein
MAALVEYPHKLVWFQYNPPELYDLGWDPLERSDLARAQPELVERMSARLKRFVEVARLEETESGVEISDEVLEALERMGYVQSPAP